MERNKNDPFFMFVSFNAVHTPMDYLEEDLPPKNKIQDENRRQLYAMTKSMDRACGRILDKLKGLGLSDNTLVIFTNDNGGAWINYSSNGFLSGVKGTHLEGGIRVPFLLSMGDRFGEGNNFNYPISTLDLLPTFVVPDRPALLYNLAKDETEQKDLAKRYPKKVEDLYKKLFAWEITLKRSLWMTKRQNSKRAMDTFDKYKN